MAKSLLDITSSGGCSEELDLVATYILSTVYITPEHLSALQKMSNDFLWRGCNHLQEKLMQNTIKWGGLKHIYIKHIMHKIRVKWMIHLWED